MPENAAKGLCFVCRTPMAPNGDIASVQFIGDAESERGRWPTHFECATDLKRKWLTRDAQGNLCGVDAHTEKMAWPLRLLAWFFAWGAKAFRKPYEFR